MAAEPIDEENTVEADEDPEKIEIAHLETIAADDEQYAEAARRFAEAAYAHARILFQEGKFDAARKKQEEATKILEDAAKVLELANQERTEADRLREHEKHKLAVVVKDMSAQSLESLSYAVREVQSYVRTLEPLQIELVASRTHTSEEYVWVQINTVIGRGDKIVLRIEQGTQNKREALELVGDLMSFVASAIVIAEHVQPLMELIQRFGSLLLQFWIGTHLV